MESVEFAILDWIQQHLRCGFLDTVLPAVSWICNHGEVWIILAAVLLLRFTGLPAAVVSVLYICTAMPCAATTAMQSEMYHCDNSLASRGVALSTAFSILTLPLMLLLA